MIDNCRRGRTGFHLTELLVVLAIIAVLLGLLIPAALQIRAAADRAACQNNLHQLVTAVHEHHDQFGTMPPYAGNPHGRGVGCWFYSLLPYVEGYQPAPSAIHGSLVGVSRPFTVLVCPSDPSAVLEPHLSKTNYLANWYALTDTAKGCVVPAQSFVSLSNGLSNVVLFAEAYSVCKNNPRPALESPYYHNFGVTQDDLPSDDPSYLPRDFTMFQVNPTMAAGPESCDPWRTQTPHSVMHVGVADGSVRSIQPGIDPLTWKKALKPRTGQPPIDW
jgi:prepilin-type N-terminal cleavage/methylation domain-containing protein